MWQGEENECKCLWQLDEKFDCQRIFLCYTDAIGIMGERITYEKRLYGYGYDYRECDEAAA